jgi:hypothetical protein
MAKNVTLWNASYSNVPAITVPKTGGGTATFYDADGTQTKTQNGTYDVTYLSELVVDVPYATIYTGSSVPSSSQGVNGDVYIRT